MTIDGACGNGDMAELTLDLIYTSTAMDIMLSTSAAFAAGVEVMVAEDTTDIALAIPDNADAVEFEFDWSGTGILTDVGVTIGITHTYIGDLTVELVHPDGTAIMLHNRVGGSAEDINETYGLNGLDVGMSALAGKAVTGVWKVRVQDHAGQDTGTLDAVSLVMKGYIN